MKPRMFLILAKMVATTLLCMTIQRQKQVGGSVAAAFRPGTRTTIVLPFFRRSHQRIGQSQRPPTLFGLQRWSNQPFGHSNEPHWNANLSFYSRQRYASSYPLSMSTNNGDEQQDDKVGILDPLPATSSGQTAPRTNSQPQASPSLSSEKPKKCDYHFQVTAPYPPTGDQPQAIESLVKQMAGTPEQRQKYAVLRGCTGTGKTLVMAHTIARLGKCKTLVLCHNKTLAAQLARELRTFFDAKKNALPPEENSINVAVELFVSYYNHYVPESFSETTNKYIAKKSSRSDELDALRHLATRSLLEASSSSSSSTVKPTIIVSSVSCIYGLGMPSSYLDATIHLRIGQPIGSHLDTISDLTETLERTALYANVATMERPSDEELSRNNYGNHTFHDTSGDLGRGQFQLVCNDTVGGDNSATATLYIWPPTEAFPMRIDLEQRSTKSASSSSLFISSMAKGHSTGMTMIQQYTLFPARHFVSPERDQFDEACRRIQDELVEQVQSLKRSGKHVEADRLSQRVTQDLMLLSETGTCPGIENYSRHMALREAGEPPDTLLDYLGYRQGKSMNFGNDDADDDWLLIVDESHVTLPQLKAMYYGDRARKRNLVKHGYRLPSCLDHRPLTKDEFWDRVPQALFVSATPAAQEIAWMQQEQERLILQKQLQHARQLEVPLRHRPSAPLANLHVQTKTERDGFGTKDDNVLLMGLAPSPLAGNAVVGQHRSYYRNIVKTEDNSIITTKEIYSCSDDIGSTSGLAFEDVSGPVDMMIRPTFVCDPVIEVRPAQGNQLQDLADEIRKQKNIKTGINGGNTNDGYRTLALALTKRDAEDMAEYLVQHGIKSTYIHSRLTTLERSQALTALQDGTVDCLVGVNLLREGLDLPEVSLVAIWNADAEGFLRSETALLQMVGRAARNVHGKAIFYANRVTESMKQCMDATARRRQIQLDYNAKHGKTMRSTEGSSILSIFDLSKERIEVESEQSLLAASPDMASEDYGFATTSELLWDKSQLESSSLPLSNISAAVCNKFPSSNELCLSSAERTIETDHIPSKPGVYFWKDGEGQILYIGKAKSLRSRVKSYLSTKNQGSHSARIRAMLNKARSVEFILTPSDRDALILESGLIKQHQPLYNVRLKDDETYPYICATIGDSYPQFTIVPTRHEQTIATSKYRYFGPYPNFSELYKVLQGIEAKYDLRGKSFQARHGSTDTAASKEEYCQLFDKVMEEVFSSDGLGSSQGDDELIRLSNLRSEFEEASKLFESKYNECRDVVAVAEVPNNNSSPQSRPLTTSLVIHLVQLRDGLVAGSFSYTCELANAMGAEQEVENFSAAIETVLVRRHYPSGGTESFFPDEILVPITLDETKELRGAIRSQRKAVKEASLNSKPSQNMSTVKIRTPSTRGPRKDTDARAIEFATDNAEQVAFQKSLSLIPNVSPSSVDGSATRELASLLSLNREPKRIECYDISHTQGDVAVGSRVVFVNGRRAPHLYRKFNIKTVQGVDDYASLEEVLERRFRRASGVVDENDPWALPDLVVIDGGQGQLTAALKGMAKAGVFPHSSEHSGHKNALSDESLAVQDELAQGRRLDGERRLTVPIVALAKQKEEVFIPNRNKAVNDAPDSAALLLLRSLRDESHRFALTAHRKRRSILNGLQV